MGARAAHEALDVSSAPAIATPGIWSSPNRIAAPPGAVLRADNCVIRSKGVIEPRRGHAADVQGDDSLGVFQSGIAATSGARIWHQSNGSYGVPSTASRIWRQNGASLGNFDAPSPDQMRMRFARMLSRTYCTTSVGPQRILTPTTNAVRAGLPRPDMDGTPFFTIIRNDTGGFLAAGSSCAYRVTVVNKDSDGREIESEPSGRLVIKNTTATAAIGGLVRTGGNLVTVTTLTAHGLRAGDEFRVTPGEANFGVGPYNVVSATALSLTYIEVGANVASTVAQTIGPGAKALVVSRVSFQGTTVTTSSIIRVARTVSTTGTPSEDYFLILERSPTAGEVTALFLSFTDNTPDAVVGPLQYYSASSDGLLQAKGVPPYCKTLELVGDNEPRMAYANTVERQRVRIQLLSTVAASGGLQNNDTVTVVRNGQTTTLTFKTASVPGDVFLATGGSPTSDIQVTAIGMVDRINQDLPSTNTVRATYLSGPDDPPGLIQLEALDDLAFPITVSSALRPNAFNAQLPVMSAQIPHKNRVYLSEPRQPDAVPPLQYLEIGDPDEEILAVRQAMDTTFVLKQRSAWVWTGDWPNIRVQRIDATLQLIAPDTAAVIGTQVYCLTTQGVVALSNGAVGVIGLPIEDDLSFIAVTPAAKLASWGCAYDSERHYLLAVPTASTDVRAQKIYAYNTLEKTWTRWNTPSAGGCLDDFNNIIRYGDATRAWLRRERKTHTRNDFYDEDVTANGATVGYTVTSVDFNNATLTFAPGSAMDLIRVGDAVNGFPVIGIVLAVDEAARTARLSSVGYYNTHDVSQQVVISRGYECLVEWLPETAGDPSRAKHAQEAHLHFQRFAGRAELQGFSEMSPAPFVAHTFSMPGFGLTVFGAAPFGDPSGPRNERALFTRDGARGAYSSMRFRCAEAYQDWRLQGRTLEFAPGEEKSRR